MNKNDSKLFAFLGVLLTIVGFIVVILARKKDKYAMFYAKQGLVLFVAALVVSVVAWASAWLPIVGGILGWVLQVAWIVLWIIGLVYSLSDKEQYIPVIGSFAKNF